MRETVELKYDIQYLHVITPGVIRSYKGGVKPPFFYVILSIWLNPGVERRERRCVKERHMSIVCPLAWLHCCAGLHNLHYVNQAGQVHTVLL